MYPKIHEGEVSEVESWFSELPLICFHCNQHNRFLWSRQRQHSHANTLKDGDSPSWAVYLDTLDKDTARLSRASGFSLVSLRIKETVACWVQDLEAIEFGNPDTLHQKKGPVQHLNLNWMQRDAKSVKQSVFWKILTQLFPWFAWSFLLLLRAEASEEEEERAD